MNRNRPHVGVGVIVTDGRGRVLIGHRIKAGEPPSWCLPGGHLETGESVEAAALREVREESGLAVARAQVFILAVHVNGSNVTFGVRATATSTVARLTEPDVFNEWTWAEPGALPAPLFPPSGTVLAAWQGRPVPPGWAVYAVAGAAGAR